MADQESLGLENAVAAISGDYPQVPRDEVLALVHEAHIRFEGRPVRDFVPVLVERAVRAQLHDRGQRRAS